MNLKTMRKSAVLLFFHLNFFLKNSTPLLNESVHTDYYTDLLLDSLGIGIAMEKVIETCCSYLV